MPKFSIYNIDTGEDLGIYDGATEDLALDAVARDYGFMNYSDCIAEYGVDADLAKAELRITRV